MSQANSIANSTDNDSELLRQLILQKCNITVTMEYGFSEDAADSDRNKRENDVVSADLNEAPEVMINNNIVKFHAGENSIPLLKLGIHAITDITVEFNENKTTEPVSIRLEKRSIADQEPIVVNTTADQLNKHHTMFIAYRDTYTTLILVAPVGGRLLFNATR